LSTDMALTLSKLFMRTISQNPNENQTGISLWTLDDIERHKAKQQQELVLAAQTTSHADASIVDGDDDYDDGGLDDSMLAQVELDV
jgi:DNA excision repair protein ERCC-2